MITPPDTVIITITGREYAIEALCERAVVASQSVEVCEGCLTKSGDDLFTELPVELAVTLHEIDLKLQDVVLALMPEAA